MPRRNRTHRSRAARALAARLGITYQAALARLDAGDTDTDTAATAPVPELSCTSRFRFAFVALGEGLGGDYDPSDPDDVEMLRVDIWAGDADPTCDEALASACTEVPVATDDTTRAALLAAFAGYADTYRHLSADDVAGVLSWARPSWLADRRQATHLLAAKGPAVTAADECVVCGREFTTDGAGVTHHTDDDSPTGVDHDADADHVAYAGDTTDEPSATTPGPARLDDGVTWADADGDFVLADGGFGNPGCDACGEDDAVALLTHDGREFLCRACFDGLGCSDLDDRCARHAADCDGFCDHLSGHVNACALAGCGAWRCDECDRPVVERDGRQVGHSGDCSANPVNEV